MKILFFTHYYPPEGNAPATRVAALARHWVGSGNEVTVVTCVPNVPDGVVYAPYRNWFPVQEEERDGVHVIRVWTFLAPNRGTIRRTLNYLSYMAMSWMRALLLPRPDVVIATSPQFFCGWAGVLTKWSLQVRDILRGAPPLVIEIRDIWPESIGAVGAVKSGVVLRLLERLERIMYRSAARIVTVGPGYRRRLLERGVAEERIEVVMNGVDRDETDRAADGEALRSQFGLEGKIVCSYVGTIGMACGLDVLLRAGKLLRERGREDVVLLAIGDGAVRGELAARAENEGLGNVRFLGRREKKTIPAILAMTDVCLVHLRKTPLFESVMPSKIFEAAGARRPILNGVEGDARELVERAQCGISFEPENAEALVEGLLRLADDEELRERLGQRGFEFVREHFDREVLAKRYLQILHRL